ncbi:hypothetical protein L7F22_059519 [Adiantum nelumboides]|nr:hypothetical protein [Adiantum nelumboides]
MATCYVSKWVEAKALPNNIAKSIAWFLYEHIISKYQCPIEIVSDQGTHFINDTIEILTKLFFIICKCGCPVEIVSDQGTHFINDTIEIFTELFSIKHMKSTPYYPRCNGQAKSNSKTIKTILTKIVQNEPHNWDEQLQIALWAYRTAYKVTTRMTPFKMVYGAEAVVPLELAIPNLRMTKHYNMDFNTILKTKLKEL